MLSVNVAAFFDTDPSGDAGLWEWELNDNTPALPTAHSAAVAINKSTGVITVQTTDMTSEG